MSEETKNNYMKIEKLMEIVNSLHCDICCEEDSGEKASHSCGKSTLKSYLQNFISKAEIEKLCKKIMRNSYEEGGLCKDCNSYKDNEHHENTCGNYNQSLSDLLKKIKDL